MSKKPFFDQETLKEIREGQKLVHDALRRALWPLPTLTYEEQRDFLASLHDSQAKVGKARDQSDHD